MGLEVKDFRSYYKHRITEFPFHGQDGEDYGEEKGIRQRIYRLSPDVWCDRPRDRLRDRRRVVRCRELSCQGSDQSDSRACLAYGKPGVAKRDRYISGFWETVSIPLWRLHFTGYLLHYYRSGSFRHVQAAQAYGSRQTLAPKLSRTHHRGG